MRALKVTRLFTERKSSFFEKYLSEISKIDQISWDEEVALSRRIQEDDDPVAIDRLVLANLRFVVSVAKQYQNQGLSLNDLVNEGNYGIIKAAKKFDHSRGFKFISYAVWWIRQSIMQAIADNSRTVRVPGHQITLAVSITRAIEKLEHKLCRYPTPEEIIAFVETQEKLSEAHINVLLSMYVNRPMRLDAPLTQSEGDEITYYDVVEQESEESPDEGFSRLDLRKELLHAMRKLDDREKKILTLYYGLEEKDEEPLKLEQISEVMGLTRERTRQIKEKALKRLRKLVSRDKLRVYLK